MFSTRAGTLPDGPADLVLKNGDIYTGSTERPRVQAIAIRGEWIVATGSDDQVAGFANTQSERPTRNLKRIEKGNSSRECLQTLPSFPQTLRD